MSPEIQRLLKELAQVRFGQNWQAKEFLTVKESNEDAESGDARLCNV
jgi:hypothetical protein